MWRRLPATSFTVMITRPSLCQWALPRCGRLRGANPLSIANGRLRNDTAATPGLICRNFLPHRRRFQAPSELARHGVPYRRVKAETGRPSLRYRQRRPWVRTAMMSSLARPPHLARSIKPSRRSGHDRRQFKPWRNSKRRSRPRHQRSETDHGEMLGGLSSCNPLLLPLGMNS